MGYLHISGLHRNTNCIAQLEFQQTLMIYQDMYEGMVPTNKNDEIP